MNFRSVAGLIAVVCLALFAILFFAPGAYVGTYGVAADPGAVFMAQRASPMFVGLAIMLWLGRSAPRSALRDAVCVGMAMMFAGIAVTGTLAYLGGAASFAILVAALAEIAIAAAFLFVMRRD